MKHALLGALVTAAVSTVGDYLWAYVLPHRQPIYWFAHAIVLFITVGLCLGLPSRRPLLGTKSLGLGAISSGTEPEEIRRADRSQCRPIDALP